MSWAQFSLAPTTSAAMASRIAVVSRIANSMELWWIANDGSVQGAYWYQGSTWQRYELAPAGSASLNGGIAAVSRIPTSMELWYIGQDGSVQDHFWYQGGNWGAFQLAPAGSASLNGGIAAVSRIPTSMELWYVGHDGSVLDDYWYQLPVPAPFLPASRTPGQRPKPPVRPLDTTDIVLTPGGLRPRSLGHTLRPGEHVSLKDGRVRIIESTTGNVVKDLGEIAPDANPEGTAAPPAQADKAVPGLPDTGWIENAQWRNGGADPIVYFTTTWVVPSPPGSDDGQTVYLFNGMQPDNAAHILQPVLQWGPSPAGGGNNWSITNWYADGQGGPFSAKTPISVDPGTVLQGVITCTGQSEVGYNYTCQFIGYPDVDLSVTDVPELTWAYETLECYGPNGTNLTQCSDYPSTALTTMYDIEIKTGTPGSSGSDATISWQAVATFNDCGQNCVIVSDASPGGAVDLDYRVPVTAEPGSALACFGVNGSATRLYYLDTNYNVNELAWVNNQFVNSVLPGSAVPRSSIACFGVNGSASRVYYLDADYRVDELAWLGNSFVNNVL